MSSVKVKKKGHQKAYEKCSTLLIIGEIHIQAQRYFLKPSRVAILKKNKTKPENNKYC